jgi:hypothetical protein
MTRRVMPPPEGDRYGPAAIVLYRALDQRPVSNK